MTTSLTTGTSGAATGANGALTLTSNASNSAKSNPLSGVDFTTYITLLAKQLQNQDPMKPMDSAEFTSQIATYAQLEQQISSNQSLQKIAASKDYSMQAVAATYLDKDVLSSGNTIPFDGSHPTDFGYTLTNPASSATVEIVDNTTGATVRTLEVDGSQGAHNLTWDGKDDSGNTAAAGTYTVKLSALDSTGAKVAGDTLTYKLAVELVTTNGETDLKLADGSVIPFTDVTSVRSPSTSYY